MVLELFKGYSLSRSRSASFLLILALAGILTAQPRPRITQRVDSTRLTRLGQTTHPLTRSGRDLGRAARDLPMERRSGGSSRTRTAGTRRPRLRVRTASRASGE